MAPNKRADNKRILGAYIDKHLYERFKKACEDAGLSMTEAIMHCVTDAVDKYEKTIKNNNKEEGKSLKDEFFGRD